MSSLPRSAAQGGGNRIESRERPSREGFWPRYLRRNDSLCAECGYGLSGLDQPRCPECGHLHSLAELSCQANFESAGWYLSAGWGLLIDALIGVPVGLGLLGLGVQMLISGNFGVGLGAVAGGVAALVMPIWGGGWLRQSGGRIQASWGSARYVVSLACWAPSVPLLMGGAIMVRWMVGSLVGG